MTELRRRAGILAMAFALAGCSGERLRMAVDAGVEGVALKLVASEFASRRGLRVEIVELGYDALYAAARDEIGLVQAPSQYDVIMMDDPWFHALGG